MKKALLLLFLFCSLSLKAQKPIESFLTIKFGSSLSDASKVLSSKGGIKDLKYSDLTKLTYDKVKMGTRTTSFVQLKFVDDMFYEGAAVFKPYQEPKTVDLYNEIQAEINEIYGEGKEYKEFKSPYEDGDGHELFALKNGYAEYNTYWIIDSGDGTRNAINLTITPEMFVKLIYQSGPLYAKQKEKVKEATVKDY